MGWAGEPLTDEALEVLRGLERELADGRPLAARLAELITDAETEALRARVAGLLRSGRHQAERRMARDPLAARLMPV